MEINGIKRHAKKISTPLKYRDKPVFIGYSEDYFLRITQRWDKKAIYGWILKKGEKSMEQSKEEFVEIVKKVRDVLKTDECATCS